MARSSQDISGLVFRPAVRNAQQDAALDGTLRSVLAQFDGSRRLGEVAGRLGKGVDALRPAVSSLLSAGLIEHVNMTMTEQNADKAFMDALVMELSIAIGPLGSIVVEEGLQLLGCTRTTLPARQAPELVNILSREIPRAEKQVQFKQAMLTVIREKGYV